MFCVYAKQPLRDKSLFHSVSLLHEIFVRNFENFAILKLQVSRKSAAAKIDVILKIKVRLVET